MGPTGTPTEIPRGESVLLAGGGLGNAVLFSIARALRDNGNKVLYFAGYKKGEDLFKREEIEAGDRSGDLEQRHRRRDRAAPAAGRALPRQHRPGDGRLRERASSAQQLVPLSDVDRLIAIGSDRMMAAVKDARHAALAPYLRPDHVAIASINSPMQCMMKEICAQCLQKHVDPVTGKEEFVFSCFNQDQEMDHVDFPNLNARLRQNTMQEKLSSAWLDHLLESVDLPHWTRPGPAGRRTRGDARRRGYSASGRPGRYTEPHRCSSTSGSGPCREGSRGRSRLSCSRRGSSRWRHWSIAPTCRGRSASLATDLARYGPTAVWNGIYYRGEKIGFTVSQTITRPATASSCRRTARLQMLLLGQASAGDASAPRRASIASFALRSFDFSLDPGTGAIAVRGVVDAGPCQQPATSHRPRRCRSPRPGATRTERRELSEAPVLTQNLAQPHGQRPAWSPGSTPRAGPSSIPATLSNARRSR